MEYNPLSRHIEKRTEFEDDVDAGNYVHQLFELSKLKLRDFSAQSAQNLITPEVTANRIASDVRFGGTLPKLARQGIIVPYRPQTIYLLEYLPSDYRRMVNVLYNEGEPAVLMPRIPRPVMREMFHATQLVQLAVDTDHAHLLAPRETWGTVAERMHEAVFYPGSRRPLPPSPSAQQTPPHRHASPHDTSA